MVVVVVTVALMARVDTAVYAVPYMPVLLLLQLAGGCCCCCCCCCCQCSCCVGLQAPLLLHQLQWMRVLLLVLVLLLLRSALYRSHDVLLL